MSEQTLERGLYVIVDTDALAARGLDVIAFATAALAARPVALQLRAKNESPGTTLALLRALKPICTEARVPLVANDRADLAMVAAVDMVHVGQTDATPSHVRLIAPRLALGISTHTPEQLIDALAAMPAYVAFGPVWATRSKAAADATVGVSGIRQAAHLVAHAARETRHATPLVAIGGVTLARVAEIAPYVTAAAVISDLIPPPDFRGDAYAFVRERADQFRAAFATKSTPEVDANRAQR